MENSNPYVAPEASVSVAPATRVDGKWLVVPGSIELCQRCVACNAPGEHSRSKTLFWATPWIAPLILLWIILYLLVYLAVRKRITVSYSLCDAHRRRVRRRTMILLAALAVCIGMVLAGSLHLPWEPLAGFGLLALIGLLLVAIFWRPADYLRIRRFRKGEFWLAGLSAPFLAQYARSPE